MKPQVRELLKEAQRRYLRFRRDESLTEAWTGLGSRATYEPVLKAGLMEWIFECPPPRIIEWLRLTESGAEIVQDWMDKEVNREDSK
jgi:hypothetical protein